MPGADSTPLETSMASGRDVLIAASTLSGVMSAGEEERFRARVAREQRPVEAPARAAARRSSYVSNSSHGALACASFGNRVVDVQRLDHREAEVRERLIVFCAVKLDEIEVARCAQRRASRRSTHRETRRRCFGGVPPAGMRVAHPPAARSAATGEDAASLRLDEPRRFAHEDEPEEIRAAAPRPSAHLPRA